MLSVKTGIKIGKSVCCLLMIACSWMFAFSVHAASTFTNPIYENGADPWLMFYKGNYYVATTTWSSQIAMRKSPTLAGLADAEPVNVWSETDSTRCCNFWAFEFHRLKGPDGWRWYMLYVSGRSGTYDYQHISVLESVGDDPMGPYQYKGSPMEDSYNIDGSYLSYKGHLYLMYSKWDGDEQKDFMVELSNPWTVKTGSSPIVLTHPEYDWERVGLNVNEGPEALIHNDKLFIVYSASYCNTPDYKLGMLELTGSNPMNPDDWTKSTDPVFVKGNGVYGPGHNGFFTSPDGKENWLVYHGNANETDGCGTTRSLRAQPYTWNTDGTPNFGEPVASGTAVTVPSGENGPLVVKPLSPAMLITTRNTAHTTAGQTAGKLEHHKVIIDPIANGVYRLANEKGLYLTDSTCTAQDHFAAWQNKACQTWKFVEQTNGTFQIANSATGELYTGCTETSCENWSLSPVKSVAVVSAQSGKVLTVSDTVTVQESWRDNDTQKWQFELTDDGYVTLAPQSGSACATGTDSGLVMGDCSADSAKWFLRPLTTGGYQLVSKATSQVLDLHNCLLSDGTSVSTYSNLNNICQRYYLRDIK